jgi:hypothetical protein
VVRSVVDYVISIMKLNFVFPVFASLIISASAFELGVVFNGNKVSEVIPRHPRHQEEIEEGRTLISPDQTTVFVRNHILADEPNQDFVYRSGKADKYSPTLHGEILGFQRLQDVADKTPADGYPSVSILPHILSGF